MRTLLCFSPQLLVFSTFTQEVENLNSEPPSFTQRGSEPMFHQHPGIAFPPGHRLIFSPTIILKLPYCSPSILSNEHYIRGAVVQLQDEGRKGLDNASSGPHDWSTTLGSQRRSYKEEPGFPTSSSLSPGQKFRDSGFRLQYMYIDISHVPAYPEHSLLHMISSHEVWFKDCA